MGDEMSSEQQQAPAVVVTAAPNTERGFPAETPVAEMTDAEQAAYWKHHARRHEQVAKARADYDELKARAEEADKLRAAAMTEQEKAVAAAKEEGRREERVSACRDAASTILITGLTAAGVDTDKAAELLGPVNLDVFVTDGKVDVEKVRGYISTLTAGVAGARTSPPDMGQSHRGTGAAQPRTGEEIIKQFGL